MFRFIVAPGKSVSNFPSLQAVRALHRCQNILPTLHTVSWAMALTRTEYFDALSDRVKVLYPNSHAQGLVLGQLIVLELDQLQLLSQIQDAVVLKAALSVVLASKGVYIFVLFVICAGRDPAHP